VPQRLIFRGSASSFSRPLISGPSTAPSMDNGSDGVGGSVWELRERNRSSLLDPQLGLPRRPLQWKRWPLWVAGPSSPSARVVRSCRTLLLGVSWFPRLGFSLAGRIGTAVSSGAVDS